MTDLTQALDIERQQFLIKANGGISLPVAGLVYWLALTALGFVLTEQSWTFVALFTSGLIFPLGLALAKPLKSNLMVRTTPLSTLVLPALLAMLLSLPITIAVTFVSLSLVPLTLSIGMSLHWPIIGWMYNSKTCLAHAIIRVAGVTLIWFLFPTARFTFLPLFVAFIYLFSVIGLRKEVADAKQRVARTNAGAGGLH